MRATVPAMDELIGKQQHVLDDGFVSVVDYMGDDAAVVAAARVSYLTSKSGQQSDDRTLIRYLMRHRHTTPFEMCELKLHVRVPMDCWRQWIRHRTASVNETSTRYAPAIDSAQRTPINAWRMQSKTNRQGSSDDVMEQPAGQMLSNGEERIQTAAFQEYQMRLDAGIAREQARKDLPLSTYTEAFWKINLHNLLHFLGLRMDSYAQQEIREYANVISGIVRKWCPFVFEAFLDYRLHAISITVPEARVISLLPGHLPAAREAFDALSNRERDELEAKLRELNLLSLLKQKPPTPAG